MAKKIIRRAEARKPTAAQVAKARRELALNCPPEPGDPELQAVLYDVLQGLRRALDVAITVCAALAPSHRQTTEAACAAGALMNGCANELSEQIEELEKSAQRHVHRGQPTCGQLEQSGSTGGTGGAAMSANVGDICSPWQLAAEASERTAELIDALPGWEGYRYAPESQDELQRAAELLQQAVRLLEQAGVREARKDQ